MSNKAFLLNSVIALLHDQEGDRWHPIVFVEHPLPGPSPSLVRHKSKMHHTTGFDTRKEAEDNARDELAAKIEPTPILKLDKVYEWDGRTFPTIVEFFGEDQKIGPCAGQS